MNSFALTDKFQAFVYRTITTFLAFNVQDSYNFMDASTWQSGHEWPLVIGALIVGACDYAMNLRTPLGTNPTHDGNA